MLESVDLPEPFSPTSPSTVPLCSSNVTSVTAFVAPNSLNMCSALRIVSAILLSFQKCLL